MFLIFILDPPDLKKNYGFLRKLGSANDSFQYPYATCIDNSGRIVVVDRNSIQLFSKEGVFIKSFGAGDSNQFGFPSDLVVTPENEYVVMCPDATVENPKVVIFDSEGEKILHFGEQGPADGQIQHNRTAAIDHDGNIVITEATYHKIQVFTTKGQFVRAIGKSVVSRPLGICIDPDGNYVVCNECQRQRPIINIFTPGGTVLRQFNPAGVDSAWSIAAAKQGLVISDNEQHSIVVVDWGGKFLMKWGEKEQKMDS